MATSNKTRKNKKPLYILLGFFIFFGLFIYLITLPSKQSIAIKELESSFTANDVESVWNKYKADLFEDEEFLFATRTRLSGFDLNSEEIESCRAWLPAAPKSINLIVVPDLSRRIIDEKNNPHQIDNDIFVLNIIWSSFVKSKKLLQNTKDSFIVDVTDIDQAKGQFSQFADSLQFDLSTHRDKSNRLFFTDKKNRTYESNILKMYESAKEKPLGADYKFYLRRYLVKHLKKPTLFDDYINKVVIITDGYLEAENSPADTKITGYQKILYPSVVSGTILEVINSNNLNIPKVAIDLSNTEILVCEVSERHAGRGYDFEILKVYWEDWFERMGAKKTIFIQREQSSNLVKKQIENFVME